MTRNAILPVLMSVLLCGFVQAQYNEWGFKITPSLALPTYEDDDRLIGYERASFDFQVEYRRRLNNDLKLSSGVMFARLVFGHSELHHLIHCPGFPRPLSFAKSIGRTISMDYLGVPLGLEFEIVNGKHRLSVIGGSEMLVLVGSDEDSHIHDCGFIRDIGGEYDELDLDRFSIRLFGGLEYSIKIKAKSSIVFSPLVKFQLNGIQSKPDVPLDYSARLIQFGLGFGFQRMIW